MDIETIRMYCIKKHGVTESMPFDNCILVFKVGNKMFAAMNICEFESINLKYPTDDIDEVREANDAVKPGYHMHKRHRNTIVINLAKWKQLAEWIDISYGLVFDKLSKKVRADLQNEN